MGEMKVLLVSSESFPFAGTGGLAYVCRSLAQELQSLGTKVTLIMPLYREVMEGGWMLHPFSSGLRVELGREALEAEVYKGELRGGIEVLFVRRDEYFDRSHLYGTSRGDYFDNARRFTFFSKAVVALGEALGWPWEVVHCHDWQTALVPVYLWLRREKVRCGTVFTIHNLGYQGIFPPDAFALTGLPGELFCPEGLEFWGKLNLLKGGIYFSSVITTVSPTYAREIQTPEFGFGLDGVLRACAHKLVGILNGVDYETWSPERDPHIAAHYSKEELRGKRECKNELIELNDLSPSLMGAPLFGMISRLVSQKGIDILIPVLRRLLVKGAGVVILGEGEERYEEELQRLAQGFSGRMSVVIAFDESLSHKVLAGCDIYLMPSRYEPCGLAQMRALRYGTVPVVRHTGGLADTVTDLKGERGTGFSFHLYRSAYLWRATRRALRHFARRGSWRAMMRRGMKCDFSWRKAAEAYLQVYERAKG